MIVLSLESINASSYYNVASSDDGFWFTTDAGVRYHVKFIEDNPIGGCETYQFAITKEDDIRSGYDPNVRQTSVAIIEEFFARNQNVLLYICDTSDGREASRDRLFRKWFEDFASQERYTLKSAHAIIEGEGFYAAIIVEKTNPLYDAVITDFEYTARVLTQK